MISSLKSLLFAISTFFGPVALSCQAKLIVVDNLRESILSCIFWLKYINTNDEHVSVKRELLALLT